MKRNIILIFIIIFCLTNCHLSNKNILNKINKSNLPNIPQRVILIFKYNIKINKPYKKIIESAIHNFLKGKNYIVENYKNKNSLKKSFGKRFLVEVEHFQINNFFVWNSFQLKGKICYNDSKDLNKKFCNSKSININDLKIFLNPVSAGIGLTKSLILKNEISPESLILLWCYKLVSTIPDSTKPNRRNLLQSIVTNISSKTFKFGDKIILTLTGEPGLTIYFNIDEYKKNIKLYEISKGYYKGYYTIKKNDYIKNSYLIIHAFNNYGEYQDILISNPSVNIDGILPSSPYNGNFSLTDDCVKISWKYRFDNDFLKFLILKKNEHGNFTKFAETTNPFYKDCHISPDIYLYKIIAIDKSNNYSNNIVIGPIPKKVIIKKIEKLATVNYKKKNIKKSLKYLIKLYNIKPRKKYLMMILNLLELTHNPLFDYYFNDGLKNFPYFKELYFKGIIHYKSRFDNKTYEKIINKIKLYFPCDLEFKFIEH